jgi:hypothetical protein
VTKRWPCSSDSAHPSPSERQVAPWQALSHNQRRRAAREREAGIGSGRQQSARNFRWPPACEGPRNSPVPGGLLASGDAQRAPPRAVANAQCGNRAGRPIAVDHGTWDVVHLRCAHRRRQAHGSGPDSSPNRAGSEGPRRQTDVPVWQAGLPAPSEPDSKAPSEPDSKTGLTKPEVLEKWGERRDPPGRDWSPWPGGECSGETGVLEESKQLNKEHHEAFYP